MQRFLLLLLVAALSGSVVTAAEEPPAPPTLEATYLGLSYGPMRQARLVPLPEGVLARAPGLTVTSEQLAARLAEDSDGDEKTRLLLEKNAPFLLERMVVSGLLESEARAWALAQSRPTENESPGSLIETHLRSLAAGVTVTTEEARAFFTANPTMFPGATFEQVEEALQAYLISQKQDALIAAHINGLSARTPVELDAAWYQAHAPAMLETPVDEIRRSGKPALVDFGAGGCMACDMMTPLLEELRAEYAGRASVLFVSVRDDPLLGARYGIRVIPVQVLFNAQGKEVFRHEGFWGKDAMVAKLAELGVK